jgi:transcriptional regulator with XRE-family HTH domain
MVTITQPDDVLDEIDVTNQEVDTQSSAQRYSEIGLILKEKMRVKRITVSSLAKRAGVSFQSLNNILYGYTKNPGFYTMRELAVALGASLDELGRMHHFLSDGELKGQNIQINKVILNAIRQSNIDGQSKLTLLREIHTFITRCCRENSYELSIQARYQAVSEILHDALQNATSEKAEIDPLFAELILMALAEMS